MFGKSFARMFKGAQVEVSKLENRDLMEAMVGGCALAMAANGVIDDKEVKTTDDLLRSNKNLEHFGAELSETLNRFAIRLKAGYRVARAEILDEIGQISADPKQKRDVLLNMITVCDSDGTIDSDEKKELAAVANVLGLSLEDWL